jgi:hypothetical protein
VLKNQFDVAAQGSWSIMEAAKKDAPRSGCRLTKFMLAKKEFQISFG